MPDEYGHLVDAAAGAIKSGNVGDLMNQATSAAKGLATSYGVPGHLVDAAAGHLEGHLSR